MILMVFFAISFLIGTAGRISKEKVCAWTKKNKKKKFPEFMIKWVRKK